jgi:hypothetical protein
LKPISPLTKNYHFTAPRTNAGPFAWEMTRASSVVDKWCKAHDLDNLYVVDASVFVSSAAVNPTLTIVANALRVGDHLARHLNG